jgi:hypothetical protein
LLENPYKSPQNESLQAEPPATPLELLSANTNPRTEWRLLATSVLAIIPFLEAANNGRTMSGSPYVSILGDVAPLIAWLASIYVGLPNFRRWRPGIVTYTLAAMLFGTWGMAMVVAALVEFWLTGRPGRWVGFFQ